MADNKVNLLVTLKDNASSALQGLKSKLGKFGEMLNVTTLAVVGLAAGLAKLTFASAKAGDEFAKTASMVGTTANTLSKMTFAAQIGGAGMSEVATTMRVVSKRVNDANNGLMTSVRSFKQAGIAVRKTNGELKTAEQLVLDSADAFSKLESPVERTALAQELFGRSGTKLIPMLLMGKQGIKELMEEAELLGITFTELESKQAEDFQDELLRLQSVFVGMGRVIGKALTPLFTALFTFLYESMIPVLKALSLIVSGLTTFFTNLSKAIPALIDIFVGLGTAIKNVTGAFGDFLDTFRDWWRGDLSEEELSKREEALGRINKMLGVGIAIDPKAVVGNLLPETTEEAGQKGADEIKANFMDKVTANFKMFKTGIKTGLEETFGDTGEMFQELGENLIGTFNEVGNQVGTAFGAMITESESFSKAMKQIWEDLKMMVVQQISQMIAKWLIMMALTGGAAGGGGILGGLGLFAKGGIISGGLGKATKIPSFANGGITTAPTLAVIGDNPNNREAVVPLPDGRSIPVSMEGGVQSIAQLNILPNANIDQALMDKPMSFWVDLAQEKILPALNSLGKTGATTSLEFRTSR
jgi:hypothetical protein